jgi:hypothetical protein
LQDGHWIDHERFFITGGTLVPGAPCYIKRSADDILFHSLAEGEFCYVLNARQMGKSSLMVSTATRLTQAGAKCLIVDLTAIGQNVTIDQWYFGVLGHACGQLGLTTEVYEFWKANARLSPFQRWTAACRQLILPNFDGPIIIFLDEIDLVRSLPFTTDEFFAGIRELYNSRSLDENLKRLTFCLLGVATPAELVADSRNTPFNIGRAIVLADFTFEESQALAPGIHAKRNPTELLERIFYWTDGHPFLTQRLMRAVAEDPSILTADAVDEVCHSIFFSIEGTRKEDNFSFVRDRLLLESTQKTEILRAYLRIYRKPQRPDAFGAPGILALLLLSGAVKVKNGYVCVRNRLYRKAFDPKWIHQVAPEATRIKWPSWMSFLSGAFLAGVLLSLFLNATGL